MPNVFSGLSYRPDELRAFLDYYEVVMAERGRDKKFLSTCILQSVFIIKCYTSVNQCKYLSCITNTGDCQHL